jgi:hypothetical protein
MNAVCHRCPDHATFVTTAHVVEEWRVTADGSHIETATSLETTHAPGPSNTWCCHLRRHLRRHSDRHQLDPSCAGLDSSPEGALRVREPLVVVAVGHLDLPVPRLRADA